MKLRIFSTFAGYGTDHFALKQLGIPYENVGFSEIDKYATQCFKQNHGGENYGDITKIDWKNVPDFDLLTGGFPCTDVSVAGKQDLSKGRTILGYELVKALIIKQPEYFLFENVKGLMSKKFNEFREELIKQWTDAGYNVYYKVLNTKDYGIPQSRSRVWFVGFRKDIDKGNFKWPEPEELKIFIKDILEQEVDKKYYLSEKLQDRFSKYLQEKNRIINLQPRNGQGIVAMRSRQRSGTKEEDGVCWGLTGNCGVGIIDIYEINGGENSDKNRPSYIQIDKGNHSQQDRIYNHNNCCPTIVQNIPKILDIYNNNLKEDEICPTLATFMGTGGNNVLSVAISNSSPRECGFQEEISPTLLSRDYKDPKIVINNYILRKLTPKECFRLQGFLNDEIDISNLSDTQCYKLAGNGQSVNVVMKIFKEMFK
jgi:DNA (cytosine-5)-methyltransferase 1